MNLHQTQSIQTMCELMDFAAVPYHIITPKDGKNIIDFVQDTMLASYRLTKDHVRIREKSMANLQMVNSYFNGKLPTPVDKDHHLYTGKQAYSAILPPGLMMEGKNRTGQKVIVYNGELKEGTLDKGVYNAMSEGLIPRIFHDYGPFEARRFLDNTQRLMCRWLMMSGFSCGISDLVIEPKTVDKFKTIVQTMKEQAYRRIQEVRSGGLDNHSIFKNNEFFEMELVSKLQAAFDEIGSEGLNQINDLTNRMINMVKSGSKGSEMNVAQMIGALGQQLIDGKRIQYGFTDRTLPHYTKFDDGPEARGFVENSFIKGLEPHEVFFHAMGGREGLIDTAVKSVSGETPIVVMENGKARYVEIGDWIDRYMETYPKEIVVEDDRPDLEFLKIDDKVEVYIPTVDDKGTVTWGQLTAVTRHDPTEVVYEVETAGGRKVTVADSESLLIWDSKKEGYYKKHSSLVCEGDLVPVTMNLVKPPQVTEYVDMTEYFPKTEYVYGTEFNKCVQLMKEAQGDKFHIPRGWYEENNGKTFTLPYISKARVQRVTVRSNTENMREDCIYPYHATREHSHLPDKFMLDYDNGVFVGLYLADGCFHEDSGTISIAKDDKSVQEFVGKWFDKYGITHRIDVCKKERGTSTSIIGSSTLFARFIHKFVGHGARNKHIPDVAYTAPEEFVKGLLSGYISGDGCIQRGGVSTLSVSRRLTEGISYLCSRLGIFGKITTTQQKKNNLGTTDIAPMHHLSIRAQWARLLSKEINLVHTIKNEKLKTMKFAEEHANFKEKKDTVMDTIVKIKRVNGMERCKKMYDVTVPSTLNFVTGNGLGHRDTSETGYIQRRMVKAMEDCKVYYDNTVRNATGSVVQFVYGEDGMDGTKLEQQQIPYIQQSLLEMDHQYHLRKGELPEIFFTKDAYTEIQKSDWEERSTEHYKKMVEDREFLITKVFKNMLNGSVIYPIPFKRLIRTAALKVSQVNLDSVPNTLTPMEILDTIDRLMDKLHVADKEQGTQYLHILLRLHLNPKMILLTHHLTKPVFEWVVAEIERYFYAAVVQPGETVGIIAAQSIGEPCTQLSANRETVIRVLGEENFTGPVYKFIDKLLEKNPEKVIDLGSGSVVMNMDEDYYIVGVSDTEKTSWKRISQISRHYANGRLMTVHTRSGKKTTATMSHSFLKRTVDKIVPIEGTHLKVGDRIPVAKYIPEMEHAQTHIRIRDRVFPLDKEFGWVIGAYLADGNINGKTIKISKMEPIFEEKLRAFGYKYGYDLNIKERLNHIQGNEKAYPGKDMTFIGASDLGTFLLENFKTGSYEKGIPAWVYGANREFISGILSGYFDGDGNVNADGQRQCIRAHSVNEQLIDDMIVLLAYCGIFANKLVERRNREISNKFFVAVISKKYAQDFYDNIGLATPYKSNDLLKIIDYNNRENRHDQAEYIDKIPELGSVIAYVGKRLELPGQSRNYGRWQHKESIGRRTLERYITVFDEANKKHQYEDVTACIKILKQAAESHVIWDEIIEIIYHEDPKEFVYDFTVPGNDSFMVDTAVLVHNTLNSFHSSGTAAAVKATSGVPRLRELLSVSKNIKTPTLLIYLQPDIAPYKDKAEAVLQSLEMTKLGDILEMSEIFWDPPGAGFQTGVGEDKGVLDIYHAFSDLEEAQCSTVSPWVLRMKLNKQKMYRMGLRMMDIYTRLMTTNGSIVDCVFSDDNAAELILRIRLTQLGLKDIDPEDSIAALKAIEYNFVNGIGNSPLLLKGMQGIRKVSMRQQNQQRYNPLVQAFEKMSEWVLDTDGTNLMEILSNPNVDTVRTVSNDVREIFEVLGIEAARTALYNEIYNVIRDSSLNSRHLYLLVDTITNRGTLMSIDRHGINRADVGPLAKSSFEETTDMLIKAGVFSEFDRINGVSANIMLGQLPPCGTGDSEILLDEELFIQLIQGATQAPEMAPIEKETTTHSEACGVENLSFTYKLPTLSSTIQFPLPQVTLV